MAHWLVKTEPEVYSIDDLKKDRKTLWTEVRNYQARNYLKSMKLGDELLVYHSNAEPSGVAGIARISALAVADPTQFDKKSAVFDPKATLDAPRWFSPEVELVRKGRIFLPLAQLRGIKALKDMELLRKGSRLSVQPVTPDEFRVISTLLG
jgi:predicted RNA-binding protein with PUA-like domain